MPQVDASYKGKANFHRKGAAVVETPRRLIGLGAPLRRQAARCEAEGIFLHRMVTANPLARGFVDLLGRLAGAPGAVDDDVLTEAENP